MKPKHFFSLLLLCLTCSLAQAQPSVLTVQNNSCDPVDIDIAINGAVPCSTGGSDFYTAPPGPSPHTLPGKVAIHFVDVAEVPNLMNSTGPVYVSGAGCGPSTVMFPSPFTNCMPNHTATLTSVSGGYLLVIDP